MFPHLLLAIIAVTLARSAATGSTGSSIVLNLSPNHSLKPPVADLPSRFLVTGDVDSRPTSLRLCSQRPDSRAALWARHPNHFPDWQAVIVFRVAGDKEHGGDGLGFWYAKNVGQVGPVNGGPARWHGLAVFVDTDGTDTDGASRVVASLNQNDVEWSVERKGEGQYFGGCLARLRNTAAPVHMRVTYVNRIIKVELDDGKEGQSFANCLERANTDLPPGMFFGLTAGTSDQPDLFDILSFEVFELKREANPPPPSQPQQHQQGNQQQQQQQQPLGELERQLSNMQNNLNTVMGRMMPGDRPIMQRLESIEQQLRGLSDRLASLQDLLTKVVSKSAAVDPTALLHTLNDIRDSTRSQLQALAVQAGHAEEQTQSLVKTVIERKQPAQFWWWMGFAGAQVTLLLAYQLIKKKFEDKSKKFI